MTEQIGVPVTLYNRRDVAAKLLASARALGHDVRVVRFRRGNYWVPLDVARHAGYLPDEQQPEPPAPPKRSRKKAAADPEGE